MDIEPNVVEEKDVVADFEAEKVIITESTAEEVVAVTETVEDRSLTQTASDELIASTPSTVIEENAGIVSSEPEFAGRSLDINIQTDLEEATQISVCTFSLKKLHRNDKKYYYIKKLRKNILKIIT